MTGTLERAIEAAGGSAGSGPSTGIADSDDWHDLIAAAVAAFDDDSQHREGVRFLGDSKFGTLISPGMNALVDINVLPEIDFRNGNRQNRRVSVSYASDLGYVTIDSVLGIQEPALEEFRMADLGQARSIAFSALDQLIKERIPSLPQPA
jgi:hypothetical protein